MIPAPRAVNARSPEADGRRHPRRHRTVSARPEPQVPRRGAQDRSSTRPGRTLNDPARRRHPGDVPGGTGGQLNRLNDAAVEPGHRAGDPAAAGQPEVCLGRGGTAGFRASPGATRWTPPSPGAGGSRAWNAEAAGHGTGDGARWPGRQDRD